MSVIYCVFFGHSVVSFLPRCVCEQVLSEVIFAVIFWWLLTVTGICQVSVCRRSACMCIISAYTIMTGGPKKAIFRESPANPNQSGQNLADVQWSRGDNVQEMLGAIGQVGANYWASTSPAQPNILSSIPDTMQYTQCYFMARRCRP